MIREYSVEKYPGCLGCFEFIVKVFDDRHSMVAIFTISFIDHRPDLSVKNFKLSTGYFGFELTNAWNKFIRFLNSECSSKVLDDINEYDQHLFD